MRRATTYAVARRQGLAWLRRTAPRWAGAFSDDLAELTEGLFSAARSDGWPLSREEVEQAAREALEARR